MRRFWSSVMLTSGRYSGKSVALHRAVPGIERSPFADWLAPFTETAPELFDIVPALEVATKAQCIAARLQYAAFHRFGDPPEELTRKPAA